MANLGSEIGNVRIGEKKDGLILIQNECINYFEHFFAKHKN